MRRIVYLTLLLCGLNLAHFLNNPYFKQLKKPLSNEQIGKEASLIGAAILFLSVLSLIVGPWLVRHKGWKFSVAAGFVLGVITTIGAYFFPTPLILATEHVFVIGLEYVWIIPLIQMTFLKLEKKERLAAQAWIFLVAAPLLEVAAETFGFAPLFAFTLSLAIFLLMFLALHKYADQKKPS